MLKVVLVFVVIGTAVSAHAEECLQSWRHDDGRLLTIQESFDIGSGDGRGFIGLIGERSYLVVREDRSTAVWSYVSDVNDLLEYVIDMPRRPDRRRLPPARTNQSFTVHEGPLLGRWTGEGCRFL